jgi:hypothetical protein
MTLILFFSRWEEWRVIKDEESEYFKMVKIQWWVLVKKGSNLDE